MAAATLKYFLIRFKALRNACDLVPGVVTRESKHTSHSNALLDPVIREHSLAWRPDRPTLEMCLATISIALGMVMAGTGDLDSLRLLRQLRLRIDEDITYGAFE